MKHQFIFKSLIVTLLALFLGTGVNAEEKTSTLTFTAACGGSGTADDGASWTVTSDGTESTFDNTKGIHYGTGSAQVKYIALTTSDIPGTITNIVVNASTASGVEATVSVTVGGSAFGQVQSLTSNAADYTFTGSATGTIVVRVEKPQKAAKALYVKSIAVTYSATIDSSNLSYDPMSVSVAYDKKDNFTAPTLSFTNGYDGTITYTSSNPSVATVNAAGVVEIKAVGVTTITASGAATDYLKASEASFTLTVNDIQGSAIRGESLFKETFNGTTGTGGSMEGNSNSWNGNIATSSIKPDEEDWKFSNSSGGASCCIKLGASGTKGYAMTRYIDVEIGKTYTLTFKAAPWDNETTKMFVSVTAGCDISGISEENMTPYYWNNYTATITPNSVDKIRIKFEASSNRFFLDEINVAAPATETTVQVTIPSSGWGTFCYKYPLDFTAASSPEGLKAYAVSSTSSSNATLTQINEKIIGGTGIIINGTPGATYAIKVADQGTAYSGTNLLTGTLSPTYIEEGQYFLKSGRFVYSSAGILRENKAYLKKENAPEAAANFDFVVEDVTGISEVLNNISLDDDKWYDLSGRAVSPTSKGIYIHNGKKYVIK